MGLIDRRAPAKKSVTFISSETGHELTITAKASSLPCSADVSVLLALILLTQETNLPHVLTTTRYRISQLIGGPINAARYARINKALAIWQQTQIQFKTSWKEDGEETSLTKTFSLLAKVENLPPVTNARSPGIQVTWPEIVWKSFQNGAWRLVDLRKALQLRPLARQLYCFLEYRHRAYPRFEISLQQLAHEHLGASRQVPTYRLLQALRGAITELKEKGCIAAMDSSVRIFKTKPGLWHLSFEKASPITQPTGAKQAGGE